MVYSLAIPDRILQPVLYGMAAGFLLALFLIAVMLRYRENDIKQLKPCPNCGQAPLIYLFDRGIAIVCDKQPGCMGFKRTNPDDAFKAWNEAT